MLRRGVRLYLLVLAGCVGAALAAIVVVPAAARPPHGAPRTATVLVGAVAPAISTRNLIVPAARGSLRLRLDRRLGMLVWGRSGPYVADHVLVGFRLGTAVGAERGLEARVGALRVRRVGVAWLLLVRPGRVWGVIDRLRRYRWVRYAEPDYVLEASGVPNDPSFHLQWGLQNTGQSVGGTSGTAGADEEVVPAWNVSTGSSSIVVAVTDTGVDYNHPDLAANMWSNPGGVGGCAAGTHGFDVLAGESACDPMDSDTAYNGHGSHVAGIIGAVGNNGVGVAGVNWTTSIMAVKWLDSESAGSTSDLLSALQKVVTAKQAGVNVRVANDSSTFPGTAFSQALSDEIDTLGANNILFVTAAGNTGQDNDTTPRYPCSYDRANEICVAASDQNDQLPSWANYGPGTVDLAAPGVNIYSTLRSGTYGYISGASMSAAEVSGAAALILSASNMSATALKADILNNVDPIKALSGLVRTGGRLDICKAMPGCTTNPPPTPPTKSTPLPVISGTAQVGQTVSTSNGTWGGSPATYTYNWQRCDPSNNCSSTGVVSQTYLVSSADVGDTLEVAVTATNTAGFATETSAPTATVTSAPSTGTFGKTTVGASSDTAVANRKRVNRYSVSSSVSVTKLTIYLQQGGSSGTQTLEGVIYADSGGSPGALIAVSNQLTFASTNTAGWYDLPFSTPVSLAPGNYWIGFMSGSTSYVVGFRYDSVSGARLYNANTYSSGPSNPFGSASSDSEQISLYATYTTG